MSVSLLEREKELYAGFPSREVVVAKSVERIEMWCGIRVHLRKEMYMIDLFELCGVIVLFAIVVGLRAMLAVRTRSDVGLSFGSTV